MPVVIASHHCLAVKLPYTSNHHYFSIAPGVVSCGDGWEATPTHPVVNVTVMWSEPASANGIILGYTLDFVSFSGDQLATANVNASGAYTFTSLTLGKSHGAVLSSLELGGKWPHPLPESWSVTVQASVPVTSESLTSSLQGFSSWLSHNCFELLCMRGKLTFDVTKARLSCLLGNFWLPDCTSWHSRRLLKCPVRCL